MVGTSPSTGWSSPMRRSAAGRSSRRRQAALPDWRPAVSSQQLLQRLEGVGFTDGFVPADAVDARKAHRHPRFVAGRAGRAVESEFANDLPAPPPPPPLTLHPGGADAAR